MKLKQLLASVIICAVSFTTKAQIGKGSVWLGGAIGYNSTKNNNNTSPDRKNQTFTATPGIGIAIKENTVAGVDLTFGHSKQENDESTGVPERKTNTYGIGVFVRRYVPVISRLYIFGQGRAGYSFTKSTDIIGSGERKTESWSTGLTFNPGVSFAVNNKIQLETGLNNLLYVQYSKSKNIINESNNFSAGVSLENGSTFYVGIRFLLNKKS
jgi:opacity protein-like surface antigen